MSQQTKYAIIGLGYIAERHLRAIKETGGDVVLAFDTHETGGIVDRYFLNAKFAENEKHFFDHLAQSGAEYLVICTPNAHHINHIKDGLKAGVKVICEKPLCVKYDDAATLIHTDGIYTILQLRLHPTTSNIKEYVRSLKEDSKKLIIEVKYHTPRGEWYHHTWKARQSNGGIMLNIGVHIFDLLIDVLGIPQHCMGKCSDYDGWAFMEYPDAYVMVRLSIYRDAKPERTITVNGMPFDLTSGFDNLHTESYKAILEGNGFKVSDAVKALKLVEELNNKA